ncbi:MAG: imidazole glycerol phosphate synthase subunit HisF [Crocinitomicaceae bacterium]|nr:imidazole glycerol phosphate synthase subunit HisF [Crocinitomicaceae bacterium]MBK8925250.1 imidazole glycerol phosphate synthase subunit HisF [Crocinitomicaceae bacterium]
MRRIRVIPILLVKEGRLVKTTNFSNPRYIGDPINTVKIFNEKGVDEIALIDISAGLQGQQPNFSLIRDISSEAFMPFSYGGGIQDFDAAAEILKSGVEKIIVNSLAFKSRETLIRIANTFGSQSLVISVDIRKNIFGKYSVYSRSGTKNEKMSPVNFARSMEENGAGELIIHNIDREGTSKGFDFDLIESITSAVNIPCIALGGASGLSDFRLAVVEAGASAVAAGNLFVYNGPHKAVLINYPSEDKLYNEIYSKI